MRHQSNPAIVAMAMAAVAFLSGCANSQHSVSTEPLSTTTPMESTSTTESGDPIENSTNELPLALSGCIGAQAFSQLPRSMGPPATYPEWETSEPGVGEIGFVALICERVSFQEFERGPVSLVIEYHGFGAPPEECWGEAAVLFDLVALWIDDADLATALHGWHNLTTRLATIERTNATVPNTGPETWTFATGDAAASAFAIAIVDSPLVSVSDSTRFVWASGGGVAFLQFNRDYEKSYANVLASYGAMSPPTLWSEYAPNNQWAGQGDVMRTVTLDTTMGFFLDHGCKLPTA